VSEKENDRVKVSEMEIQKRRKIVALVAAFRRKLLDYDPMRMIRAYFLSYL
jgi:hypothetical protein